MDAEIIKNAKIIWNFLQADHEITKSDCIFTMGSNDLRVAERSAELFLQGYAENLIFSGGLGRFTENNWKESEAEKFARIAIELGVPKEKIILETKSTNSGENVLFTKAIIENAGFTFNKFILVQKPYMEKRAYATFIKLWPGKAAVVTSPQLTFESYPNDVISQETLINIMVGDFQRLMLYPQKGFLAALPISSEAEIAFNFLVDKGFRSQLI